MSALCVALAAPAVGAAAAKPHGGKGKKPKATRAHLDRSFGREGFATTAVSESFKPIRMALAPGGRSYVLRSSLLLAFEGNGKPAADFGHHGRVRVAPTAGDGEGEPTALAVDSKGRVLVTGSTYVGNDNRIGPPVAEPNGYHPVNEAFVIRLLPNGNRDVTFGSGGEVDTDFGLPRPTKEVEYEKPSVRATSILVDSQDRPIVGGGYVTSFLCGLTGGAPAPFVGRLTTSGPVDMSFDGKGYTTIAQEGEVKALAETPAGGQATLSSGQSCGPRYEETPSIFSAFTEGGEASPELEPTRPSFLMAPEMAVDSKGRVLVIQHFGLFDEKPAVLVRLLPSGAVDTSFGHDGGAPGIGGVFAVDSRNRPILASGFDKIELRRLRADGKVDKRFAPHGTVTAGRGKAGGVEAVALDGRGRIYTVRTVESPSLKTGHGIQITRFLPGS
jgi:uncharacterized delta-60 repeat protein